ncbi:agmatinase [Elusimicrobiota bacterium]
MTIHPLNSSANFLGITDNLSSLKRAKYVILPVAFERTTSYMKGTRFGPAKLLEASRQLEFFDEELKIETFKSHPIATLPIIKPRKSETTGSFFSRIRSIVRFIYEKGKFPILLGGEHSITMAPVQALSRQYKDLSVLHFDAHADLRQDYEGTPFNHACALRRSLEHASKGVAIGIRNIDSDEFKWAKAHKDRVKMFVHNGAYTLKDITPKVLNALGKKVYITIDLDGFDPSIMPGVGTPQPGGIQWHEALRFFKQVFRSRDVVGFDIMELCPIPNSVVSEFTAAKLLYRLLGYKALLSR